MLCLLKKFLVAARQDRGGREVSRKRVESLVGELSFDAYFGNQCQRRVGGA